MENTECLPPSTAAGGKCYLIANYYTAALRRLFCWGATAVGFLRQVGGEIDGSNAGSGPLRVEGQA